MTALRPDEEMTVLEPLAPRSSESPTFEGSGGANARHPAVLVRAGSRLCALPVHHVVETLRPLRVEPVSGAPPFVQGIAIIRGEPVPVLDLGSLLGDSEEADLTRFVTLRIGLRQVALAVEAVLGVRDLDTSLLREVPPLLRDVEGDRVAAVATLDEELLLVLRAARLISDELWETLASAGAGEGNGGPGASYGAQRLEDGRPPGTETATVATPDGEETP